MFDYSQRWPWYKRWAFMAVLVLGVVWQLIKRGWRKLRGK